VVAALTSLPVIWRKERFWNFSAITNVYPSSLVKFTIVKNNTKILFSPTLNFVNKERKKNTGPRFITNADRINGGLLLPYSCSEPTDPLAFI
jgi:hypothetical protein